MTPPRPRPPQSLSRGTTGVLRPVLWSAIGQPLFRQWWFPARRRPAVLRAFGAEVDGRVVIREGVRVRRPWRLRVDGPAWIGHGVSIRNAEHVTIERDVCLGRDAVVCTGAGGSSAPIVVRRGAWISPRVTVVPGTEIGDHAVVTTDAVVGGMVTPGSTVPSTDEGRRLHSAA